MGFNRANQRLEIGCQYIQSIALATCSINIYWVLTMSQNKHIRERLPTFSWDKPFPPPVTQVSRPNTQRPYGGWEAYIQRLESDSFRVIHTIDMQWILYHIDNRKKSTLGRTTTHWTDHCHFLRTWVPLAVEKVTISQTYKLTPYLGSGS